MSQKLDEPIFKAVHVLFQDYSEDGSRRLSPNGTCITYQSSWCHIPQDLSLSGVGALVKSVWSGGMSVLANFGGESVQQAQQKHV